MTKKELRIAVAKDVLKSLRILLVTPGVYVKTVEVRPITNFISTNSQKSASNLQKHCKVCALGACFLSLVKIDNKFDFASNVEAVDEYSFKRYVEPGALFRRLEKVFSAPQLYLIEAAFEDWDPDLVVFAPDITAPTDRLRAIMKNIIANDGTFKPPKVTA